MNGELVYDIGAFDGADTAYYLSLGYRVLCVEATPTLAEGLRARFKSEIASGRCDVLNVAVGDQDGLLPFYTCDFGAMNSFDKSRIESAGLLVREISVPVRNFASILQEYGVPKFMKVDIEGADRFAILPLTRNSAPEFISFEVGIKDLDLLLHLHSIGYRNFNIVQQSNHCVISPPPVGTLAHVPWSLRQWARLKLREHPNLHKFAKRAKNGLPGKILGVDVKPQHVTISGVTPMEIHSGWRGIEEMLRDWTVLVAGGVIESSWFDVHAVRAAADRSMQYSHGGYSGSSCVSFPTDDREPLSGAAQTS